MSINKKFTPEVVKSLNALQKEVKFHSYTCDKNSKNCQVNENDGVLKATEQGWICPCGDYTQDWYHSPIL